MKTYTVRVNMTNYGTPKINASSDITLSATSEGRALAAAKQRVLKHNPWATWAHAHVIDYHFDFRNARNAQ